MNEAISIFWALLSDAHQSRFTCAMGAHSTHDRLQVRQGTLAEIHTSASAVRWTPPNSGSSGTAVVSYPPYSCISGGSCETPPAIQGHLIPMRDVGFDFFFGRETASPRSSVPPHRCHTSTVGWLGGRVAALHTLIEKMWYLLARPNRHLAKSMSASFEDELMCGNIQQTGR